LVYGEQKVSSYYSTLFLGVDGKEFIVLFEMLFLE